MVRKNGRTWKSVLVFAHFRCVLLVPDSTRPMYGKELYTWKSVLIFAHFLCVLGVPDSTWAMNGKELYLLADFP
jgi:hypothetical protein